MPYICAFPTESDLCLFFFFPVRPFILRLNLWSIILEIIVKLYTPASPTGVCYLFSLSTRVILLYKGQSKDRDGANGAEKRDQDGAEKRMDATLEKSYLTWIQSCEKEPPLDTIGVICPCHLLGNTIKRLQVMVVTI